MRKTVKAVLLSSLVFPGTGHLSLKKPLQGWLLIGISIFCLYFIFSAVLSISNELGGKIQSGEIPNDPNMITELVTERVSGGDYQFVSTAVLVLMICWVFGVIDSMRIGLNQDKMTATKDNKEF